MTSSDRRLVEAARLLGQRRFHEVHALCTAVLEADPSSAQAYALLGGIALENKVFDKGVDLFARACQLAPDNPGFVTRLARCLNGVNRLTDAGQVAQRAMVLKPRDAVDLDTLGVILNRAELHEDAAIAFRKAVERLPSNPNFQVNLGWAEQYLGNFGPAAKAFRAAIKLDPANDKAYSALVSLTKQTPESNVVPAMSRLYERSAADRDRQLRLAHAIAKSLEDMGDDPAALDWLIRGKAARRAKLTYDAADDAKLFAAAAATCIGLSAELAGGERGDAPIFVLGLPRTGTTLVDRILSSHPDVTSAGEPMSMALLTRKATGVRSGRLYDASILQAVGRIDFAQLGREYLVTTRPAGAQGRFTDKTPVNFLFAGIIARALPNARIVCLRRHPVDSCMANFRQMFALGFEGYDHTLSLEEMARYYVEFDRLMAHWRQALGAERFLEVRYEDLVAEPEVQVRRLLAFTGLDWNPATLRFHENTAPVATASAVQVRQPLYASSIGRWKRYGAAIDPLLAILTEAGIAIDD